MSTRGYFWLTLAALCAAWGSGQATPKHYHHNIKEHTR